MARYLSSHAFMRYFQYSNARARLVAILAVAATLLLFIATFGGGFPSLTRQNPNRIDALRARDTIIASAQKYIDEQLPTSAFGEMGRRTETLTKWMDEAEILRHSLNKKEISPLTTQLEDAVISMYPFLKNPTDPNDPLPFSTLRKNVVPGSKGIVIAAGKAHFRYTLHLIGSIRNVLGSNLPVQVMYAGENDLPSNYRQTLRSMFRDVETLDLLTIFNDTTIDFQHGTWAIKPFAILASTFEQVIALDGDAVFLQKPDVILESHSGYRSRGALLFHDRLLWQNVFKERAEWWRKEMGDRTPSDTLQKSKVWMEGYAEECDSGVVVVDKGRLPVLMALLHICWQNSAAVRTEWTYRLTYGDKESWWFGLELCGVPFVFEEHYAAVLGQTEYRDQQQSVCSFSIAHLDERSKLLWYNGSLLKNKAVNLTDFLVPDSWMVDGEWLKGNTKAQLSCMRKTDVRKLDEEARQIIGESIAVAKRIDREVQDLGIDLIAESDMHL